MAHAHLNSNSYEIHAHELVRLVIQEGVHDVEKNFGRC